jgi:hypothetical protein
MTRHEAAPAVSGAYEGFWCPNHGRYCRVAAEPMAACVDCGKAVPFSWVKYGNPKCPDNVGATGVRYGHRIPREEYDALLAAEAQA